MVKLEEERFGTTLTVGLNKLDEFLRPGGAFNRLIGFTRSLRSVKNAVMRTQRPLQRP